MARHYMIITNVPSRKLACPLDGQIKGWWNQLPLQNPNQQVLMLSQQLKSHLLPTSVIISVAQSLFRKLSH